MNMILHGIEAPNIIHTNTLTENLADIQEKDRVDVVMANPPFGGKERKEVQQNFPIRTGETAFLFLQHFIKMLKAGGRGGVVIKNTFLSNTDNASVSLRKLLLESCNLHTVLDCPGGTFQGAGVKTVVLFFEKGAPTRKVWFYQLDPGRNLGKTNPLNDDDLAEFVKLQKTFADSPKSWTVDVRVPEPSRRVRPLREEPQRRRGSEAPQPTGHHGRNRRTGRRERGGVREYQGATMKPDRAFYENIPAGNCAIRRCPSRLLTVAKSPVTDWAIAGRSSSLPLQVELDALRLPSRRQEPRRTQLLRNRGGGTGLDGARAQPPVRRKTRRWSKSPSQKAPTSTPANTSCTSPARTNCGKNSSNGPERWAMNNWPQNSRLAASGVEIKHRTPQVIVDEIAALDAERAEVLGSIRELL